MARDQRALDAPVYAAAATSVLRLPAGRSESDRLAVEEPLEIRVAHDRGITLCGFVRDGAANVYTEPWRLEG
jgi:formate dehydrogenase assembly factor FdhD